MKNRLSPRAALVLIAAMFLLPLMLAWFMYSGTISYQPSATRNLGRLVDPPLPLDWRDAVRVGTPGAGAVDTFRGPGEHWSVLFPVPEDCGEPCQAEAAALRQVHRALGRHQERVRIVLLLPGNADPATVSGLRDTYSEFQLVNDPSGRLGAVLQQTDRASGTVYLVDPLGNIMMSYKAGSDPNNLKQDLKKLLTWSKLDEQ
jgi:cytochrome oxidase Cu insertion factor (SCO1/SenC/PrrC family)